MGKYRYFDLEEFIRSDEAKKRGIDNTPSFDVVDHLDELVREILDPLRAAYGRPIIISSGYRCPKLNQAVGGSTTSVHKVGWAADCQTKGNFDVFRDFVVDWFWKTGTKFDQILLEKNKKTGARWIHIGIRDNSGRQRGQIKVLEV